MKHYGYTAKESSAWCRVCRPGCVVGPQQQYLMSIEAKMFEEGEKFRERIAKLRQPTGGSTHGGTNSQYHPAHPAYDHSQQQQLLSIPD